MALSTAAKLPRILAEQMGTSILEGERLRLGDISGDTREGDGELFILPLSYLIVRYFSK